jgi:hypothetical protein
MREQRARGIKLVALDIALASLPARHTLSNK